MDLALAVCLRLPNRVETGVVGEGDEQEEAGEPVMLSSSMVEVEQVEPLDQPERRWRHLGVERSEERQAHNEKLP